MAIRVGIDVACRTSHRAACADTSGQLHWRNVRFQTNAEDLEEPLRRSVKIRSPLVRRRVTRSVGRIGLASLQQFVANATAPLRTKPWRRASTEASSCGSRGLCCRLVSRKPLRGPSHDCLARDESGSQVLTCPHTGEHQLPGAGFSNPLQPSS
jgi:hypothetical protein